MNHLKNSVRLIGNLGQNPEVKTIAAGKKVARFSIATSDKYKNDKGEMMTETQWHNLVIWGKLAEVAEKYLQKGNEIAIEGKLTTRNYTDKEGNKKYITEVLVNELMILGGKN